MRNISTRGFTIVELLIVVVVIAILAAITIVGYNGISDRAVRSSLQSSLEQASKKVLAYAVNNSEMYPGTLGASGFSDAGDTIYEYSVDNTGAPKTFCITATLKGISYFVSYANGGVSSGKCAGHTGGAPDPWTQIGTNGGYTSCALYNTKPYCWGDGGNGALGTGSATSVKVPTAVSLINLPANASITTLDAGGCLIADGKVYCWGYNAAGKVGDNTTTNALAPKGVDATGVLAGKTVTKVSADNHVCVLANGAPYCWGSGTYGELGNNTVANSLVPVAVDTSGVLAGKTITDISTGAYNTCVIANGLPYCWGWNLWGQLGNGSSGNTNYPTPVAVTTSGALNGKTLVAIKTGSDHVCALASDGSGYCWGGMCSNINGTFSCYGAGSTSSNVPVKIDTTSGAIAGKTIAQIATDFNHSCLVTTDGGGYCWGYGAYGRLGTGAQTTYLVPTPIYTGGVVAGKTVTQMAVGQNHSCAIASGQVYCWGRNWSGEAGDNTTTTRDAPVQVVNPY